MSIPEEGQTTSKCINVHTSLQSCFYVSNTISDGECDFLSSGGAGFTNVVTGNGNGVPQRYVLGAIFKMLVINLMEGFGGKMYVPRAAVFLQNIVLNGTTEFSSRNAFFSATAMYMQSSTDAGALIRHRSGNLAQVDLVEQNFHISQGVNCFTPTLPTSPSAIGSVES